ncbi:MAG: 2,3-bisphosphoglycerate-independent phosphoglycerate mutase [Gammaproteobacteria bacterium]|nr:2,3-bisphosphoglycerate-independent phosphoglycerate mutase [Gammaproteobacteria bacterium]
MSSRNKPAVLIILDGWGYREQREFNAIASAQTPVWDRLWQHYPHSLIATSGASVGLPGDQMGNSEVGHLNLGAGRVVYQELTRITLAVDSGDFFNNPELCAAVDAANAGNGALHIFGLLSPGGVHSHESHIQAMCRLAVERGCSRVYMHAFLDGRDMPPKSAAPSIEKLQTLFGELGVGRIASITGRYYAMDRDNRWDRVQRAYDMLTLGAVGEVAEDALSALEQAYQRGETDEFVLPTSVVPRGEEAVVIEDGDAVVFMNYRSDRTRQLTRAFVDGDFDGFERRVRPALSRFVTLTEYSKEFDLPVAFPPETLNNTFGEYVSRLGLHQLRLAETEKYAHVTFFFNGGRDEPFENETRILVPSPKVSTYDLQPQMSAPEVAGHLVAAIEGQQQDVIICNFANSDMVGHTGNFAAAVTAVEALDHCLGLVLEAIERVGGEMLITADHGNAELMRDPKTGQPHTAHTSDPVPLVYVGRLATGVREGGALCDIAPTLLHMLQLPVPVEMTGRNLLIER